MVALYLVFKLLHILAVIVFIGGLVARQLVRSLAERERDVHVFAAQMEAAGHIENRMVIPGNGAVLVFGVLVALVGGQPILGLLQGADKNWLLAANVLIVLLLLLVPLVFIPRGKKYAAILSDALDRNQITPELRAQLHDPVVRSAHVAELAGVTLIVLLMVVKPF